MEKEEVKVNQTTEAQNQSQIIAITDGYVILSELKESSRSKQIDVILTLVEYLKEDIEKIEITKGQINVVDLFIDKINGHLNKRILIISEPQKIKYHYQSYRFKVILETKLKELQKEIEKEKEEDMIKSLMNSVILYNYQQEYAAIVNTYLPSFKYKERKEILNKILNTIYSYMNIKTYENNYPILGNPEYITLYRSTKGDEGVLNVSKTSKDYYKYIFLRSDWYDELDAEFKIFKIKSSMIITELTPYSLLTFSNIPSN